MSCVYPQMNRGFQPILTTLLLLTHVCRPAIPGSGDSGLCRARPSADQSGVRAFQRGAAISANASGDAFGTARS